MIPPSYPLHVYHYAFCFLLSVMQIFLEAAEAPYVCAHSWSFTSPESCSVLQNFSRRLNVIPGWWWCCSLPSNWVVQTFSLACPWCPFMWGHGSWPMEDWPRTKLLQSGPHDENPLWPGPFPPWSRVQDNFPSNPLKMADKPRTAHSLCCGGWAGDLHGEAGPPPASRFSPQPEMESHEQAEDNSLELYYHGAMLQSRWGLSRLWGHFLFSMWAPFVYPSFQLKLDDPVVIKVLENSRLLSVGVWLGLAGQVHPKVSFKPATSIQTASYLLIAHQMAIRTTAHAFCAIIYW